LSRLFSFALVSLSLAAGWTVWYATPAGLGLTNDSAAYIGGARSILAGTGYSDIWLDSNLEPITHYPPLLSLTLSGIGLLTGLDPYRAARALNILLFAANTALMGLLGLRMTKSQAASMGLAVLFVTNADLLRIHAQVLSEPLFIFFSLLAFLAFDVSLERCSSCNPAPGAPKSGNRSLITDNRLLKSDSWLLLTGFLIGLAVLTRYSGLALIATVLAAIFLLSTQSRLRRILFFLAGVIPPITTWFIRNSRLADSATNRIFHFNPIEVSNIRTGLWNAADFLSPAPAMAEWLFQSGLLSIVLALFGLGLFAWLITKSWRLLFQFQNNPIAPSPHPLVFTTALYLFGYLGAVLFSMSFFDASTKFQPRILSPLYISWMILLANGLHSLSKTENRALFHVPLALTAAIFILSLSTFKFAQSLTELREMDGLGYASWRWRQAEVLAYLRRLPPEIAIYTNSPPAVYHVTGRASRVIPTPVNPVSGLPRSEYDQSLAEMRAELLAGHAVLVLFDVSGIESVFGKEIALQFDGLVPLVKAQGHVLYGIPEITK